MNRSPRYLIVLTALGASTLAYCGDASLEELERRCAEAREERIGPLREAAIEDCVSARRSSRTREDCERIYSDFGEGGGTVSGGSRPAMFVDLPECVEYFEAQDRQRSDGARRR